MKEYSEKETAQRLFGNDSGKNNREQKNSPKEVNNKFKETKASEKTENPKDIKNPFQSETDNISEQNSDFFYLAGTARASNPREREDKGYSFDYEGANEDWLKESVQSRLENYTGKDYEVKPREGRNTYRLSGNDKDLVKELKQYKDNPDKIREAKPENQQSYLNAYLDSTITVDAKGNPEPTSNIADNTTRLEVAKDLMSNYEVESKFVKEGDSPPSLKITGYNNHKNLRNNLKLENQQKLDKLEDMINRFEKPKDKDSQKSYNEERTEIGNDFDSFLKEILPTIRTESKKYELKNKTETGKKIDPDGIYLNLDTEVEAIEGKLIIDQFDAKDKDYLKHSEIDTLSVYILDGKGREDQKYHGKDATFNVYEDFLKELSQARSNARTAREYVKTTRYMQKLRRLRDRAKRSREEKERREKDKNTKRNQAKQKAKKMNVKHAGRSAAGT